MPDWYLTTDFEIPAKLSKYPSRFMILTAWNPMNQELSKDENIARNTKLESDLKHNFSCVHLINGTDRHTKHKEDGYMADCDDINLACDYGLKYQQDAIFYVVGDTLYVIQCALDKRELVEVGSFRERII